MNLKMQKALWVILLLLLFAGGFGKYLEGLVLLGIIASALLLIARTVAKEKIRLPRYFGIYLTFLLVFSLSTLWSQDWRASLGYLALYASGAGFWLIAYNESRLVSKLSGVVILVAVFFSLMFLIHNTWGLLERNYLSLFLPSSLDHNHIGDVWAVALVPIAYQLIRGKRRLLYWLLAIAGAYFIYLSHSRSALLSISVGVIYLFWKGGWIAKYRTQFAILTGIFILALILMGITKSTLFSRPYVLQGILAFPRYPFGVGVGSFGKISAEFPLVEYGRNTFATVAHSLPVEILSGLGIFSLVFFIWMIKASENLAFDRGKSTILAQAVFFALLVNFFCDTTYFIPTLVWLFFISLGLSQNEKH
jgi:hypothetical protein